MEKKAAAFSYQVAWVIATKDFLLTLLMCIQWAKMFISLIVCKMQHLQEPLSKTQVAMRC